MAESKLTLQIGLLVAILAAIFLWIVYVMFKKDQ
jgi:hypothetical protein